VSRFNELGAARSAAAIRFNELPPLLTVEGNDLMEFFPPAPPRSFATIQAQHDADYFINSKEPPTDSDDD
jgi:hypothetical protein